MILPIRIMLASVAMIVTIVLLGCGGNSQLHSAIRNGVEVIPLDEAGHYLGTKDTVATLTDGAYTEEMKPDLSIGGGGDSMSPALLAGFTGARSRPGTYSVRLTRQGYAPWEQTNVVVVMSGMEVQTVRLNATLHPQ